MNEDAEKREVKWRDRKHWMWFPWSFTKYEVRNGRLYLQKGLLKTSFDETLLYRIVDIKLTRTLAQKIFGTGTITLYTRVDVQREIPLVNIKNPVQVKEYLSEMIEDVRNSKKVVGKEFYGVMGGEKRPTPDDMDGVEFEPDDEDIMHDEHDV